MLNRNNNEVDNILKNAEEERIHLHHPYVGSEHLFLALLKEKSSLTNFLDEYEVTYSNFKKELIKVVGKCQKDNLENLYTPLLRKIIRRYENKHLVNDSNIEENFFIAILDEGEGIAIRILLKMDIDLDDVYFKLKERRKIYLMEESNKVGVCLNVTVNEEEKVIGRDKELNEVIETLLRKKKCNPILIGPAGVGKTAIVEELVRRIKLNKVPKELLNYKVIMIEMGSLVSGTKYRGEFEERLNKIINEVILNSKTIIFIDEIHTLVGAGGADGAINAADILKPYLARGGIKLIGATTTDEYYSSVAKDQALSRRFNPIEIKEPSKEEMYNLLIEIKKEYEDFHDIKINNNVIKKVIELSDFYVKNIVNPDKSIDLLDSSCAYAKLKDKHLYLTIEDVIQTVINKTQNCIIQNDSYIKKLKSNLEGVLCQKDLIKICNAFKYENSKPVSFICDDESIINVITDNLIGVKRIKVDFNTYNFESKNSLFLNKNNSDIIIKKLRDYPFCLLVIENLSITNKEAIDDIMQINNEGYIMINDKDKLNLNNIIIVVNASNIKARNKGFYKNKTSDVPQNFIDSFKCNLIGIKKKVNIT